MQQSYVVNYYIPVTTNFYQHWPKISNQFPLYAYLLHLINTTTRLSPYHTVIILATMMSGIFGVSIFLVSRKLLSLSIIYSVFMTVFVIFQVAVLRTMWDLHRDLFSLSLMFLIFSLMYQKNSNDEDEKKMIEEKKRGRLISLVGLWQNKSVTIINILNLRLILRVISLILLSILVASADRMIGVLFVISLLICSFSIVKNKILIVCSLIALCFFIIATLPGYNIITNALFHESQLVINRAENPILTSSSFSSTYSSPNSIFNERLSYNPTNLFVLFIVISGLLVPTGIIGIKELVKRKNVLIVPLIISIMLSFSWVIFPYRESLVADRWIILSSIFLSIFAGYGLIYLVQGINIVDNNFTVIRYHIKRIILSCVLATFIVIGLIYEVMPVDHPFILGNT